MTHYHIRWSGKTELDWEPHSTRERAEASATWLKRDGEAYVLVQEFDETGEAYILVQEFDETGARYASANARETSSHPMLPLIFQS